MKNKTKPSDFTNFPCGSVMKKTEAEQIACNIMVILERTGDVFRNLSWQEYQTERMKDGGISKKEKSYFDNVIEYCKTAETAVSFGGRWAE